MCPAWLSAACRVGVVRGRSVPGTLSCHVELIYSFIFLFFVLVYSEAQYDVFHLCGHRNVYLKPVTLLLIIQNAIT